MARSSTSTTDFDRRGSSSRCLYIIFGAVLVIGCLSSCGETSAKQATPATAIPPTSQSSSCPETAVSQKSSNSRPVCDNQLKIGPMTHTNMPLTPEDQTNTAHELDPAILSEINAIRRQLGDGVAEQLEGLWNKPILPNPIKPESLAQLAEPSLRGTLNQVFDEEFNRFLNGRYSPPVRPDLLPEINAIRQRLGGGVAKQLDGLYEKSKRQNLIEQGSPDLPVGLSLKSALNQLFDDEIKQMAGINSSPQQESQSSPADTVIRLRSAAKYLDLAANELEEVSAYELADRLRQRANTLRLAARKPVGPQ